MLKGLSSDIIKFYRFGGDEFLGIVKSNDDRLIGNIGHKICSSIDKNISIKGYNFQPTVSIGIAKYPEDGDTMSKLLSCADMYKIKETTKNSFNIYNETLGASMTLRKAIEKELGDALLNDNFCLQYQAIEDQKGNELRFEALIRLKNSKYYPTEFIPVAEKSSLINGISRFVIDKVFETLRYIKKNGAKTLPIFHVNISRVLVNDGDFIEYVVSKFNEYDIPREKIYFELPEILFSNKDYSTNLFLNKLNNFKINYGVDNYGRGYIGINTYIKLNISFIKIERNISYSLMKKDAVPSVVQMFHKQNTFVIVEGVETKEMYDYYKLYVDYIQGYYISKFTTLEEILELTKAR